MKTINQKNQIFHGQQPPPAVRKSKTLKKPNELSAAQNMFVSPALGAASVALSAHKVHGPKGCGALVLTPAARKQLRPLAHGGGHGACLPVTGQR